MNIVRKWREIATFLLQAFELFVDITIPTKNRPYGRFCKFWLREMEFARSARLCRLCANL